MIGHCQLNAGTGFGKTHLMRKFCLHRLNQGGKVIVFDPWDSRYSGDIITKDWGHFIRAVKSNVDCLCVVEEPAQNLGSVKQQKEYQWMVTESRHYTETEGVTPGHQFCFLTQRRTQLPPIFRDNCMNGFIFRCGLSESKIWEDEYLLDGLSDAIRSLPSKRHFIKAIRGESYKQMIAGK